jgi:hypothetical protein
VVFIVRVVAAVVLVVLWVVAVVIAAVVVVVVRVVAVVVVVVAAVVLVSFTQPVDGQPGWDRPYPALKGWKMSHLSSEKPMRGVLITLLPVAVALLACGYDNDESRSGSAAGGAGGGSTGEIAQAAIDTGAALASVAGQGAGALVEYQGAGKWRVHLACDTALSNERCHWDIFIEPLDGARIRNVSQEELDGEDAFDWDGEAARLIAVTGTDSDGLVLETEPGAGLRVDVLLDGDFGNEFIYWIGGGAIHRGAPTNPIDLVPTEP